MKRTRFISLLTVIAVLLIVISLTAVPALAANGSDAAAEAAAEESGEGRTVSSKAIAAAVVVGVVGAASAVAMGLAISKSTESMARQPDASSKINSAMMLGLVFIETIAIYALIVAILIFFVL